MRQKKFVYRTTLKTLYGLTDSMIAEIGEPDKRVKNPNYRSGPLASLYSIERVERWVDEHSAEVMASIAKRAERSERSKKIANRKREETLNWAATIEIDIDSLPDPRRLYDIVLNYYQASVTHNGEVAYVRHHLTNYESLLVDFSGRTGCAEGYQIIKNRVNALIEEELQTRHSRLANPKG